VKEKSKKDEKSRGDRKEGGGRVPRKKTDPKWVGRGRKQGEKKTKKEGEGPSIS